MGVYVREDVAAGTLLLLATHPLALLRSGPGGGQVRGGGGLREALDTSWRDAETGVNSLRGTCLCDTPPEGGGVRADGAPWRVEPRVNPERKGTGAQDSVSVFTVRTSHNPSNVQSCATTDPKS